MAFNYHPLFTLDPKKHTFRRQGPIQVGSLAGAAHLLNGNAGVLRLAQWEQKSHVEQKGKS